MIDKSLWEKMADNGLALVAFRAYSKKDRFGNYNQEDFIGIKFVCIEAYFTNEQSIKPDDFYIAIDSAIGSINFIGDTPEEAVSKYLGE